MNCLRFYFCLIIIIAAATSICYPGEAGNAPADTTHALRFEASEGTWISVDVSPDAQTLAFDLLGHIYSMPIAGGVATPLTEGTSWNMFPRYSPDGKKLLITSDRDGNNDLWVMDLESGALKNISDLKLPVHQGSWSAGGRHIFGTGLNMKVRHPVYQFNFYGDKQELIPAGDRSPVSHFEMHPSNGLIYFEHGEGRLYGSGARIKTYDTETGEVSLYIDRPGGACNERMEVCGVGRRGCREAMGGCGPPSLP